jgi:hypothetical protein
MLFVMCGLALQNSLESYRTSAMGIRRLQARCAAEGAAVALAAGAREPLCSGDGIELGSALVQAQDCATSGSTESGAREFIVSAHVGSDAERRPAYTGRYRLMLAADNASTATRVRLGALP